MIQSGSDPDKFEVGQTRMTQTKREPVDPTRLQRCCTILNHSKTIKTVMSLLCIYFTIWYLSTVGIQQLSILYTILDTV